MALIRGVVFALVASCTLAQTLSPTSSATPSPAATPTSTPNNVTVTALSVPPEGFRRQYLLVNPAGSVTTAFAYFSFVATTAKSFRVTVQALSGTIAAGGGLSSIAPNGNVFTPNKPFATSASAAFGTVYTYDSAYLGQGQSWWIIVGTAGTLSYNLTVVYFDTPTPLPTPGTLLPLSLSSLTTVDFLPLNAHELYLFSSPVSAMPLGFTISLQPSISPSTDADLFFSTIPPVGTAFTTQLSSTLGAGSLDSVTITPASPYWLPSGGPYYIQTLAYTACSYTLVVTPVPATPTPAPYVPAAAPAAGTISTLSLPLTPGAQATLPVGGSACFNARGDANFGVLNVSAYVIDPATAGAWAPGSYGNPMPMTAAASISLSAYLSWPINANTVVLQAGDTTVPAASRSLVLSPATLGSWWVGLSADSIFCVNNIGTGPVMYRVTLNPTPTPVPTPVPGPATIVAVNANTPVVTQTTAWGTWTFYSFRPTTNDTLSFGVVPMSLDPGALAALRTFAPGTSTDTWMASGSSFINSGALQLTSAASESGYGWITDMVRVLPASEFSFSFRVFPSTAPAGEGFCWVIHTDPRGSRATGGTGSSLGVGPNPPQASSYTTLAGAISNSISICFDDNAAGNGLPFSTYVVVNGNMTCGVNAASRTGCAHALPDFRTASDLWTVSIELDAPSNTIWWDVSNANSGVVVGSFVQFVPGLASVLAFSEFAWLGFAAGTSTSWDTFSISNYAWQSRDRVVGAPAGGDSSVYVGVQAPTRSDEWSGYLRHSQTVGIDRVNITAALPFFIYGPSATPYYAGVYCDGPSNCGYTFSVIAPVTPSLSPSPTSSKSSGATPSMTHTPTPSRTVTPAATTTPLAVNMVQKLTYVSATQSADMPLAYIAPLSSTYFEYPVPTTDPFTVYLTQLAPAAGPGVTATLNIEVSMRRPVCARAFVNVSDSVALNQCGWNADLLLTSVTSSGVKYIVVSPNSPEFPGAGNSLFMRVRNLAPNAGGAIAGVNVALYSLSVLQPNSGPSADAAGISGGIIVGAIIGGIVLILLLAAMGFFTLVTIKKMSGRAQVITVMTTSKPQEEAAPTPYGTPVQSAASSQRAQVIGNPLNSPQRTAYPPGSV